MVKGKKRGPAAAKKIESKVNLEEGDYEHDCRNQLQTLPEVSDDASHTVTENTVPLTNIGNEETGEEEMSRLRGIKEVHEDGSDPEDEREEDEEILEAKAQSLVEMQSLKAHVKEVKSKESVVDKTPMATEKKILKGGSSKRTNLTEENLDVKDLTEEEKERIKFHEEMVTTVKKLLIKKGFTPTKKELEMLEKFFPEMSTDAGCEAIPNILRGFREAEAIYKTGGEEKFERATEVLNAKIRDTEESKKRFDRGAKEMEMTTKIMKGMMNELRSKGDFKSKDIVVQVTPKKEDNIVEDDSNEDSSEDESESDDKKKIAIVAVKQEREKLNLGNKNDQKKLSALRGGVKRKAEDPNNKMKEILKKSKKQAFDDPVDQLIAEHSEANKIFELISAVRLQSQFLEEFSGKENFVDILYGVLKKYSDGIERVRTGKESSINVRLEIMKALKQIFVKNKKK